MVVAARARVNTVLPAVSVVRGFMDGLLNRLDTCASLLHYLTPIIRMGITIDRLMHLLGRIPPTEYEHIYLLRYEHIYYATNTALLGAAHP